MSKVQTSLRIEEQSLLEAKAILAKLGLNFTDAVNIFTSMIVQNKGLPFEVKLPNEETAQVIKEARKGQNVDDFSFDELQCLMKQKTTPY
ncbi:type II toxin-antitoxin system RelB/DinJ family antitoxin [Candidatus Venteria ishoeyi]|uniref:type II toxin-antitoxin system RelB/DinJ family antitoxin n=1 Tax=Candidatus Venteria ishoeyi TaxID=1899563 RepID=UPI0025A61740|nr:type II toxin-antitoxin system RelB/DinJ family antitoxin [Candidatus Venteria ishoeyi]MDM8547698.1 type II toxin-antitoxin system RelB/DinJ family antitoxin [Candidatus Venteria ishoeyi]